MGRCKIVPYEGTEPYVFVSYAHKDFDKVFPIIEELDRLGYRIWYDDGIAPGSEWPENIAQHLSDCAIVLAFISPKSMDSANCRRELTFALSKRKALLSIMLVPTEMSPGMEMQLSAQQSVLKYNYSDDEDFYRKVCSCADLKCCLRSSLLEEPKSDDEKGSEEKPVPPVLTSRKPEDNSVSPVQIPEKPQEILVPSAPISGGTGGFTPGEVMSPGKRKRKNNIKHSQKPLNKKKTGVIGACVAAFVILIAAINAVTTVHITDTTSVKRNESYLYLNEEKLDIEAVNAINKLNKLEYLDLNYCTFESGALEMLDLPDSVRSVVMIACSGVTELDFLKGKSIVYLTLSDCGITDDMFRNHAFKELEHIDVSYNEITKLPAIEDSTSLFEINFTGTLVSDISVLSNFTQLQHVFGDCSEVTDITCLGELKDLSSLHFDGCKLTELPEKFSALRLEEIYFANTGISSYDMFSNCTVLTKVDLTGTNITDINALAKNADCLVELYLANMGLSYKDVEFITECKQLQKITLDGLQLGKLDFLSNATALVYLSASNCGLTDISALSNCKKLSDINLSNNEITEISALSGLDIEYNVVLNLNHNNITSLYDLANGRYSDLLVLNGELDVNTIPDINITKLYVYYSDDLIGCGLGSAGTILHVVGCPDDKKVALQDDWYSDVVFYNTAQELEDYYENNKAEY